MGPWHDPSFCASKTMWLAPELLVSIGPCLRLWFLHTKRRLMEQHYKCLWVPVLSCHFVHAKQRDLHKNDKSIGFQYPSVVLCIQNSDFRARLTRPYGPRPHLWFWAHKMACLAQEWIDYIGSNSHLSFCACKTACLASELLVSMGPNLHLWSLHSKQRLFDQNNKSLWVPDITCHFVHAKQLD